ncbi:MAG: M14 family zinc carboxypeptidase [Bdellovibrionota bacterium]
MFRCLSWMISIVIASPLALASIASSHDYGKVQDELVRLATVYPRNAALFELGQNTQGEAIVGLAIGVGAVKNLIVATHHGNEYGSTEVALGIATELAAHPIAGRTIFVIPVLNITGFERNRREETFDRSGSTADPNRDYPGPCGTDGPYKLASTRALAEFVEREDIVSSVTLHTSGAMVLLPWGISTTDTATEHEHEFTQMGNMCAVASKYRVGNSTELLYPADGAFEDYAFWKLGIWSILIELGHSMQPSESQLARLVTENVPGLRKFMEEAPMTRAVNHDFRGRCDLRALGLDLRNE